MIYREELEKEVTKVEHYLPAPDEFDGMEHPDLFNKFETETKELRHRIDMRLKIRYDNSKGNFAGNDYDSFERDVYCQNLS